MRQSTVEGRGDTAKIALPKVRKLADKPSNSAGRIARERDNGQRRGPMERGCEWPAGCNRGGYRQVVMSDVGERFLCLRHAGQVWNARKAANRAAGLCACGAEPTPGRATCERCRERARLDRRRARLRGEGGGVRHPATAAGVEAAGLPASLCGGVQAVATGRASSMAAVLVARVSALAVGRLHGNGGRSLGGPPCHGAGDDGLRRRRDAGSRYPGVANTTEERQWKGRCRSCWEGGGG